jgi:acetylornithine deacetylase/succinyl-diaminopimelate desuccinylase-like protein
MSADRRPYTPFELRQRRDARVALYVAFAAAIAGTWGLARLGRPPEPRSLQEVEKLQALYDGIDFAALPEVQLLRRYVGIDTSEPDPDEVAGARFLAAELAAAGLEPRVEELGGKRANVWAFVEGEDPRAIVLAGHIDVEPARDQEGWSFPPFGGEIRGPWIYGRGMFDMKSLAVAQLLAVTDLARSGRKPKRSVLFLQTSAEETGSDTGARWILREHPELVARMGLVLTEGGVVEAMSHDQVKYFGIEFAQKRFVDLSFCSSNRARLEDFRSLLLESGKADPYPDVAEPVRAFLEDYAPTRGAELYQTLLADPARTVRHRGRYEKLSNFMQSMFRDELVPLDVLPSAEGGYELRVIAHLLPGARLETLLETILPEWKRLGLAWTIAQLPGESVASPIDSAEFQAIRDATRDEFPGVAVGPYFLPWTRTDSRFYRTRGIPSYGFSPFPLTVTETLQIGVANERMQLPAFVRGVAFYRALVARLAG